MPQNRRNVIIDPETGLELTVLEPAPPMRSSAWDSSQTQTQPMTPVFDPAENSVPMSPPAGPGTAEPVFASTPATGGGESQLPSSSLLDKVIFTLFGTPDSKMTPEEESAAHSKRSQAADLSRSAATNPGQAHMGIPSAGGNSLGESLDDPMQFMASLAKTLLGFGG